MCNAVIKKGKTFLGLWNNSWTSTVKPQSSSSNNHNRPTVHADQQHSNFWLIWPWKMPGDNQ